MSKKLIDKRRSCFTWFPTRFTKFSIEQQFDGEIDLVINSGVISKKISKIKLYRIKDIEFHRGFFDFFFGVSNITIFSSDASDDKLVIKNVRKGKHFLENLEKHIAEERGRAGVKYRETELA